MAENGDGRLHPSIWAALVATGGFILGIGGSVVYLGGALRQIDIDSHRIETLETLGSPSLQAARADLSTLRTRLDAIEQAAGKNGERDLEVIRNVSALGARVEAMERAAAETLTRERRLRDDLQAHESEDLQQLRAMLGQWREYGLRKKGEPP